VNAIEIFIRFIFVFSLDNVTKIDRHGETLQNARIYFWSLIHFIPEKMGLNKRQQRLDVCWLSKLFLSSF